MTSDLGEAKEKMRQRRRNRETKRRSALPANTSSLRLFVSSSLACASLILAAVLIAGCKSAVEAGHNTALDSVDLVAMTDDMAMKIAGSPQVQQAIAEGGPLKVVVEPVVNHMTAEVLPRGPAEAFTSRVRVLLSRHDPGRFVWVMNRDAWHDLRNKELDYDLGPSPETVNPQYALTATFSSLTSEDAQRRSSYYLCEYELTNLQNRSILWTGSYEVKKAAVKGFLD